RPCVAIAPGGVNTGISPGGEPSQRGYATLSATLSTNVRTAEPVEIANVAVFVACDEASFVNGTVLVRRRGVAAGLNAKPTRLRETATRSSQSQYLTDGKDEQGGYGHR